MKKNHLLLFTVNIFLLGCGDSPRGDSEKPLNADSAAQQMLFESMGDSIRGLQIQLQFAQSEQKRNDSLTTLINKLISDRQSNVSNSVESSPSPPAATSLENTYRTKIATLTREKDSIHVAYEKSNRDLKNVAQELAKNRTAATATARASDSLSAVNSNLLTALNKSRQQLNAVALQKKRDSLLLASSSTSTVTQQRELSRLLAQRDSLQKANSLLSVNAQNYHKDINRLKQQRKSDSLRLVSLSKAAASVNENLRTDRERDSLLTVSGQLAKQLSSKEGRIDRLTERIVEDSVKLLAYQAKPSEKNRSSEPAAKTSPTQPQVVSDQPLGSDENSVSAVQAENGENNALDSMASIRRWADPSFTEAKARDLREGFRLLLLAQQEEKQNPTLSLKLLREAGRYSNDSIIVAETKRVYDNNYFYEVLVQKKRRIRAISLNEKFLVANLSNDSAYLYSGVDSVMFLAKGLSKVSAVLLPPQNYLFAGSPSGQVIVHNLTSGKQQASFKAHGERITSLGFVGRNEVFIATGSADKTIYLWSNKYEKGDRLVGLKAPVTNINVSRGNLISGASGDFAPRLWNTEGKLLLNLTGHKDSVHSLDISSNARYLLTTSADKTASLWDLKGTLVRSFGGHRAALTQGKISNGHRFVALASEDGTIALWGINGNLVSKLTGHTQQVNQVIFDKTDTYLYTCSDDGSVRRWLIRKPKDVDLSTIPPFTPNERTEYKVK